MKWNRLSNFSTGLFEEHFCEIILKSSHQQEKRCHSFFFFLFFFCFLFLIRFSIGRLVIKKMNVGGRAGGRSSNIGFRSITPTPFGIFECYLVGL